MATIPDPAVTGRDCVARSPVSEPCSALLQSLRTGRGFSLSHTARAAQLDKSTLSRWEKGLRQPSITELEKVLSALEATPAQRTRILASVSAPRAVEAFRNMSANGENSVMPPVAGDLLRAMRHRCGKTLADAARAVGVAHSTLLRWERGEGSPSHDHLHRLCFTLGAHATEAAALMAGDGPWLAAEWGDDTETMHVPSGDAASDLARRLSDRLGHFAYHPGGTGALRDLGFLSLEATLWRLTHRSGGTASATFRHLLTHTYARHAEYLAEQARWEESQQIARRSLETVRPLFGVTGEKLRLKRTAWPVALIVLVRATIQRCGKSAKHRRVAAERGIEILTDWLAYNPGRPGYHSWQISEIACHYETYGHMGRALEFAQHACRLTEAAMDISETDAVLRRRDYARLLTQAGRPEEGLALLQTVSIWRGQPVHRAGECLTIAEGLYETSDRAGAKEHLHTALAIIGENRLESLRSRAETLVRAL